MKAERWLDWNAVEMQLRGRAPLSSPNTARLLPRSCLIRQWQRLNRILDLINSAQWSQEFIFCKHAHQEQQWQSFGLYFAQNHLLSPIFSWLERLSGSRIQADEHLIRVCAATFEKSFPKVKRRGLVIPDHRFDQRLCPMLMRIPFRGTF